MSRTPSASETPALPAFFVERAAYPRGAEGGLASIEVTARRAAEGRLDVAVRAWAVAAIRAAGAPPGERDRAAAILGALRRSTLYVPDPVGTEMVQHARCTLDSCLGLQLHHGDCDDLSAALCSSLESVGIACAIVGQAFDDSGDVTHVLVAAHLDGRWEYVDPSTSLELGKAYQPTRERWVGVPGLRVLCDSRPACDPRNVNTDVHGSARGEFVGIGTGAVAPGDGNRDVREAQRGFALVLAGLALGALTGFGITKVIQ